MDGNSEITPKEVGVQTAPKKDRWAFLKEAKAKMTQKFSQFRSNQKVNLVRAQMAKENLQKVNVRKKLADAAFVAAMSLDDGGGYMVNTDKIPQEFVPASVSADVLPPDSPDPQPHFKKPEVTISGNPPESQKVQQIILKGKPIAEVKNGVVNPVPQTPTPTK